MMYEFRTDLADERRDIYKKANKIEEEIDGIEAQEKEVGKGMKVSTVKVLNRQAEEAIGKPIGSYITIDVPNLKVAEETEIQQAAEVVAEELKKLIQPLVSQKEDILVVGLGNESVTPDALGPKVVNDIDVTRHIIRYLPQYIDENARPVSAISPGVLGTTGIETLEIVKGIVENIHPKLLIVIDSLASRSIQRISSSIQLANTGIVPGAGVGNKRKELSKDTLGIPVIAMGIPTVVEAATIAADSIDLFIEKMNQGLQGENTNSSQEMQKVQKALSELMEGDKYELIKQILAPEEYNFIVTPKEIDDLVINMAGVVARGINMAV